MTNHRFATLLKLDTILLFRNKIIYVAAAITALYAGILQILPENNFEKVLTTLIFTDPVMLGFMFIGVMVLFEKSGNTLQALSVTPVRPGEYLWSKAVTLTLIALIAGLLMAMAGMGFQFNAVYFFPAVILSSFLFIFLGFVGSSRIQTFNQYFIIIPLFMIPGFLPFLNYFGITDTLLWYAVPTQASLILFTAAVEGTQEINTLEIIYAFIYLPFCIWICYKWAKQSWYKTITK